MNENFDLDAVRRSLAEGLAEIFEDLQTNEDGTPNVHFMAAAGLGRYPAKSVLAEDGADTRAVGLIVGQELPHKID